MSNDLEAQHSHSPVMRKVGAGAVLVIAAALAIKLAVGFIAAIFWTVVGVALVVAILWALKTIFW
ncbi:MAG: hypothetical protein ACJ764_10375 [Solirubrobacteraceae bacterium]